MKIFNKEKIIRFSKLAVMFAVSNYCFDYLFRPLNVSLSRNISVAVGVALGIVFLGAFFEDKK